MSSQPKFRSAALACVLALIAAATPAVAHDRPLPHKLVTIIVPFPPGGSTDKAVRLIAKQLQTNTGANVVVENKAGANGIIAIQAMKSAPTDRTTLFAGHQATHAINPLLYPNLPYDAVKDFKPITTFMSFPSVLAVPANSPAKTLPELVALSRQKKDTGGLTYSSQGMGTAGHFLGAMLQTSTATPFTHIPTKGASEAVVEVAAQRVDLVFSSYITAGAFVRDGKLRLLAMASNKRSAALPNLPTTAEQGVANVALDYWFGFFAPPSTPSADISVLHQELVKAIRSKEVMDTLTFQAADVYTQSPEEFQALIARDIVELGRIVKATSMKAE
ncbi:MAG: tripartite tricarboxylate transporter substrate binding protein [Pseudomonadota bacterium]